jgi:hypothetical protein
MEKAIVWQLKDSCFYAGMPKTGDGNTILGLIPH